MKPSNLRSLSPCPKTSHSILLKGYVPLTKTFYLSHAAFITDLQRPRCPMWTPEVQIKRKNSKTVL
jgi:hypothetical protein